MRTSSTILSVLAFTLFVFVAANVDEMHEDGEEDQEYESGKLEDIYVSLPRLWLVARGQGRVEGGISTVWWFRKLIRDRLGRERRVGGD